MSLIVKMRKQNAIYWPPAATDDYGRKAVGTLIELITASNINYRVRWEAKAVAFIDKEGTESVSSAVVYVPQLPDGSEIATGGWLWLGDKTGLADEEDPRENVAAYEVQQVEKLPNMKATEFLRTAYL